MKSCRKAAHSYEATLKRCPTCRRENNQKWYEANRERARENNKNWNKANSDCVRDYKRNYDSKRKKTDPLFKLKHTIRSLTTKSFKNRGWKKMTKTQTLLGCDFKTLEIHLIQSALKNYGFWLDCNDYHIDHIVPLSSATTEDELIRLSHYTNLQFLTASDNLSKSDKLDWTPCEP